MQAQNRYNAACAAALAGSGQGKDDPPLDEPPRPAGASRRSTGSRPTWRRGRRSWKAARPRRAVHLADAPALESRPRPGRPARRGRTGQAPRGRAESLPGTLGRGRCPAGQGRRQCPMSRPVRTRSVRFARTRPGRIGPPTGRARFFDAGITGLGAVGYHHEAAYRPGDDRSETEVGARLTYAPGPGIGEEPLVRSGQPPAAVNSR